MSGYLACRPIRFAHCDPAGIAYYPRIFELCDSVIEDWTEAVLGVSRRAMHLEMGLGLPTVDLRAEFHSPCRLGDMLEIRLDTERVGNSSVDLALTATCAGEARFGVTYRQVLFTMASGKSLSWPEDWRRKLCEAVTPENEQ